MKKKSNSSLIENGFTLAELAISLTILSLIVAVTLSNLSKISENEKYVRTQEKLEKIARAIKAFAKESNVNTNENRVLYGRIPCPAKPTASFALEEYPKDVLGWGIDPYCADNTGIGVGVGGTQASQNRIYGGMVPVVTLGLPSDYAFDEWGRQIDYVVDEGAALGTAFEKSGFHIAVRDLSGNLLTGTAAFVLISHGANGSLGLNSRVSQDTTINRITASPTSANENENCGTNVSEIQPACSPSFDGNFVQGPVIQNSAEYFDDIVVYRHINELK